MTPKQKLTIATEDAFDRGTFILAVLFAGEGQLTNSDPSFGQGVAGYGRYLGTAYADFVIGDYMTAVSIPCCCTKIRAISAMGTEASARGCSTR